MNEFYLIQDPETIDESLHIVDFINQLQEVEQREYSFFDEILFGYIFIVKQQNEEITSNRLDVQIQSVIGDTQQVITLHKLELKPLKSSNDVVIYKFNAFINYPRMKLQDPVLKFTLFTNFKKLKSLKTTSAVSETSSLASFYPVERRNLLGGYQSVRTNELKPVLYDTLDQSTNSLVEGGDEEDAETTQLTNTSILSLNSSRERTSQIHHELPIIRILNIRVKNFKISKSSIISTIDVELTSLFQESINSSITLQQLNYKCGNNLISNSSQTFPITLRPTDSYKFSYKLNITSPYIQNNFDSKVNIASNFNKSLIELHYHFNKHKFKTSFITNLDMNSLYQTPSHRSLSSSSMNLARSSNTLPASLTVKFQGNKMVKLGEEFKLKVVIQNHDKRPRDLLIIFKSSHSPSETFQPNLPKIQSPIQSISQLAKTYQSFKTKPIGAISLVNELKFQLNSFNEIYENEIKLVALEVGVFRLGGIRVIDVNSGEAMSCDKLEVVVE